jgi:pSer/pThr/pTyr-binding forkhead associated (FHA) protein
MNYFKILERNVKKNSEIFNQDYKSNFDKMIKQIIDETATEWIADIKKLAKGEEIEEDEILTEIKIMLERQVSLIVEKSKRMIEIKKGDMV